MLQWKLGWNGQSMKVVRQYPIWVMARRVVFCSLGVDDYMDHCQPIDYQVQLC